MSAWKPGRGLLGPLKPLIGAWISHPDAQVSPTPILCTRAFRAFGKGWLELDARWEMGERGTYREIALFGATADGGLGFYSFTNDGKRSEGMFADGSDIHESAIAFEAQMPAGRARMLYWPTEDGVGFNFAVESKTQKGWNRFLCQTYRPAEPE